MLDPTLSTQLKSHLENLVHPIELVATLDAGAKSAELDELLAEIASLSEKISYRRDGAASRVPSFDVVRVGTDISVTFAGIPTGHEFTSLVLALLHVGGHPSKATQEVIEQVRNLEGDFEFETYVSLTCQNCPDVVQALNLMSTLNPRVRNVTIDGALFQDEVDARQVMAVPTVFLNGESFGQGRMTVEEIVGKLDSGAAARDAEKINEKDAFEVLVVGGGPAGAAAAMRSRTSSRCRTPKAPSWLRRSSSTSTSTTSMS